MFLRTPAFDIAFLLCYSQGDSKSKRAVNKLYQQLTAVKQTSDRIYKKQYPKSKLSGTDLLGKKINVEKTMLGFFNKHLLSQDIPWHTRKSRLNN